MLTCINHVCFRAYEVCWLGIRLGVQKFKSLRFFLKKIIVGPQDIQYQRFLVQLTLTHYILRSTSFWTPPTPPICLKMPKCAIFGTFWLFHFGNTPKVGVHREKFNIGKVAQFFLVVSIYVGTMSFHFRNIFPLKSFHRHRHRHQHQCSTHFLEFD